MRQIFISGTDTNVGKTLISAWIALHTGFSYFKPIQTGLKEGVDSYEVQRLSDVKIYPEIYAYKEPLSPHLAAKIENDTIDIEKIILPQRNNLIIEGVGGVFVPINNTYLMIDLIKKLGAPVILVSRTRLGTINHTLLSLEALRSRNIRVLGVIMNGEQNIQNCDAIEFYGRIPILAEFPELEIVNNNTLKNVALPQNLKQILEVG
ncbi:dethiobiotin synthase [Bartonella sp. A05]|uniref:dethiobiotin synthase n=1 Tax=Bartonella sp. A05 TaxID=2967261 RepID=UPI0022A972D9|nr:dethiobiotin synthase [Bartonella sp. A05]MCZ2204442.1 dethiobiotin synthase [Bartonella sp. A05]